MSSTPRDVKVDEDINDSFPTNANYSKMLRNQILLIIIILQMLLMRL